jgi:glyoxylase-like metal-dependent hydrolase (beta-lactamase superfamily II)
MKNQIFPVRNGTRRWSRLAVSWLGVLALAACGNLPAARVPLTQQRPLEALLTLTAYPNSDTALALVTMQQLIASHREREGYDYFGRLAEQQANRRILFRSLQAVMQARVAQDVPLLRRRAWVNDAIQKLDAGASADPLLGRLARGLVFADLPQMFGKTQQAVADLNACLARRGELPFDLDRGMYRALGHAYRTLGDGAREKEAFARAGVTDDATAPNVQTDLSVDGASGFRFGEKRLLREAEGVYVAEGYDFGNIAFIVGSSSVVAIDAGTTEPSAREAVAALRQITPLPIKYLILTHGHWDHVGGFAALHEPGTVVIARDGFPAELARSKLYHPPFDYFFGKQPLTLDVTPDRLLSAQETLREDGIELDLIPAHSGETDDALFVHDKRHDILFVGDAFMPYLGAPFVPEGSPEGYLAAIEQVQAIAPHRLVHGHPPLTRLYTIDVMPGLGRAMKALYQRTLQGAYSARPLADTLHDNFIPESLRETPKVALPYLLARDTFVQRTYSEHAGYWQANGEGIENFSRAEWAGALDLLGGESADAFVRAADSLEQRGDAGLALRIVELGLLRYPESKALAATRARTLDTLRVINSGQNPFRFIVYSEFAGQGLAPVTVPR